MGLTTQAALAGLALTVGLTVSAGAEPVKIRVAWVVAPAALTPLLFAHPGVANANGDT